MFKITPILFWVWNFYRFFVKIFFFKFQIFSSKLLIFKLPQKKILIKFFRKQWKFHTLLIKAKIIQTQVVTSITHTEEKINNEFNNKLLCHISWDTHGYFYLRFWYCLYRYYLNLCPFVHVIRLSCFACTSTCLL